MASDQTESKVRQWALRTNGDIITPKDVVELVLAVDDDAVSRHEENVAIMTQHQSEAKVRDERITALEAWRSEAASTCVERMTTIAQQAHAPVHEQHMREYHDAPPRRSDDDNGEDHRDERRRATLFESMARRTWVMWSIFLFVGIAVGNFLIMYIVEKMFGR